MAKSRHEMIEEQIAEEDAALTPERRTELTDAERQAIAKIAYAIAVHEEKMLKHTLGRVD